MRLRIANHPCCLLAGAAGHSMLMGLSLGETGEAGDHGNIRRLMHCGERSEFGPYGGPLDPTNDDVFDNHRMVFVPQHKGDSIPGA